MRRPRIPLSQRRPRRTHITAEQLASLSHEFRTPLNGVLGMARLLEGTRLTAEQRSYAAALRESGQHLLTLVNDVLDFAKLGAGKAELQLAPVDLESVLRSVCELLAPRAREKGLELGWAAPRGLRVQADESRLKQILLNFAGNAVKFTAEGGVLITVEAPGDGLIRFAVEDTGPGVPDFQRDLIFEAFAQAEVAHAQLGGAGLGLAIARRLAHAMDGEVGVETSASGGALFWFEAELARLPSAARQAPSLAGRRVGVASPSWVVREAARRQIEACGGQAVIGEALAAVAARTRPTDALLVDHRTVGQASALDVPPDRKAIILLSADERDRVESCRDAGFAGYLIKPLRQASLAERVLIAVGAAAESASEREDERLAAAAAPGARVLLVEDNQINAMLAKALLAREGCVVDHAQGGEEAIAAVQVGAYDVILMDMRMPGLSGEETARALRAAGVATPIVALTANVFDDDRAACVAAGMDDFLVKPLSPNALRATLARWIGQRWTEPAARAKLG